MVIKRFLGWFLAACLAQGIWTGLLSASLDSAAARTSQDFPQIDFNLIADDLDRPVQATHASDGSERLFVVEQAGLVLIVNENGLLEQPFLDIVDRVTSTGEQGLLSIAFPPGFGAGKGHFYVYYTRLDGDNQLSRFSVGDDPNQADPESEEQILLFPHPTYSNHNGGQLAFGPDGYLYIGTGDGGGGGDPQGNAQDPGSLLGKLLRIDVEYNSTGTPPGEQRMYLPVILNETPGAPETLGYRIPPDNPFVGSPGYREEVWALGLRNPWRFSFDRLTGDLYIGDVGQTSQEEIDYQPSTSPGGENYGWPILEGKECYQASDCDQSGLTLPVVAYPTHADGTCSVTGGMVYRALDFPTLQNIYFFADYCNGVIWGLQREGENWEYQELADTAFNISSFGEDETGELYFVDHANGGLYQIIALGKR